MKGKAIIRREPGQPSAQQHVQSTTKRRGVSLILGTHLLALMRLHALTAMCNLNLLIFGSSRNQSQTLNYSSISV